jgi:hypothetical protein
MEESCPMAQLERQVLDWEKQREHPFSVPHSLWVAKSLKEPMYPVIEPIRFSLVATLELLRLIAISLPPIQTNL